MELIKLRCPECKSQEIVRQAKLGASFRVQVPIGQGLASHPYRVLRDWEGGSYNTKQGNSH